MRWEADAGTGERHRRRRLHDLAIGVALGFGLGLFFSSPPAGIAVLFLVPLLGFLWGND